MDARASELSQQAHQNVATTSSSSSGAGASSMMVEAVKSKISTMEYCVEWPLQILCDELLHDLLHPRWEIRHGAGVALREVIKLHGSTAGMRLDSDDSVNSTRHEQWLDDVAIRLICVFALDRFNDFGGDHTVAPVRETCAQVLGAVGKHMSEQQLFRVVDILLVLAQNESWEVRLSGLLGLKYLMAVRQDHAVPLLTKTLPLITATYA